MALVFSFVGSTMPSAHRLSKGRYMGHGLCFTEALSTKGHLQSVAPPLHTCVCLWTTLSEAAGLAG